MGVKDFYDIPFPWAELNHRRSNSFTCIPITSKKCRRSTVEWVTPHIRLDDGPFGEDCEPSAKKAVGVELAMGEDVVSGTSDGLIVFPDPALLEADNVGGWAGRWRG